MNYLSVCSGIEAATVAWHSLGFTPAAFSEIEAFPSAVLAHHYPDVPNLGDMESHASWKLSGVDLLVGGTPCQSFSVAGLRKGMADPRGNLALVYLAIADELGPEWLVWENVPGVLSSSGGRDFGAFLGGLGELGYGWAYRILDAQYFGVPQRRRRVFVVGCARGWQRAAAVLFERASLRGDSAPSRETGARVAGALSVGASDGGGWRIGADEAAAEQIVSHPLLAKGNDSFDDSLQTYVADPIQANEARTYCNSGNNPRTHNLIAAPLTAGGAPNSNAPGRRKEDDENLVACFDETQITHRENRSTASAASAASAALARGARAPAIAFKAGAGSKAGGVGASEYLSPTLGSADSGNQTVPALATKAAVRRLTPRECERLQGFPDDYTLIPYRGKLAADTSRYRALGNSMAVPVMKWIGERIVGVFSGNSGA